MFLQDARDDVGGAQNAGMLGILVKTGELWNGKCFYKDLRRTQGFHFCLLGKYREGDENKINPPPHLTCDSFPDAIEHILKNLLWDRWPS